MSKLDMARAFAGPDASDEEIVKCLYRLDKFEHEFWWGTDDPKHSFPGFREWVGANWPEPWPDEPGGS